MIRNTFFILLIPSLLWFPFSFSLGLVLLGALVSPAVPLAAGIFAEALYGTSGATVIPFWYLLLGAVGSAAALGVHRFFETSIIR